VREAAIEVVGLSRDYGSLHAVNEVSFTVRRGEIFGYLGPNGAGKTTTVRMLAGLLRPTGGQAQVAGYDVVRERLGLKAAVGVVPERSNLYDELSGMENLVFMAQLYGLPRREWRSRAETLLREFDLWEAAGRKFGAYSRGMKRRLTIAAALVHRPEVLFLDEPTAGLDVMSARSLRQTILRLNSAGMTIFLTTHLIREAEELCQRVAILVQGRIRAIDTPARLRKMVDTERALQVSFDEPVADAIADELHGWTGLAAVVAGKNTLRILADDPTGAVVALGRVCARNDLHVRDMRLAMPSLEDAFVHITGLGLEVMEKGKSKPGKER